MSSESTVTSIFGAEGIRRRPIAAVTDAEHLSRIVAAQGEIVRAGLDPHNVVDVVTQRAQELTRSSAGPWSKSSRATS